MRVSINPKLSKNFDNIPNDARPKSHQRWWFRPFIRTMSWEDWKSEDEDRKAEWYKHWPSGVRYEVRCLDGGAWDRTTNHGMFATLEEAMSVASDLADLYKDRRNECGTGGGNG
jgi:hypothetical protein